MPVGRPLPLLPIQAQAFDATHERHSGLPVHV